MVNQLATDKWASNLTVVKAIRGDSNEYLQRMFLWRTGETYPSIIIKYPPYLFFCSEFTIPLIDLLQDVSSVALTTAAHTHEQAKNYRAWYVDFLSPNDTHFQNMYVCYLLYCPIRNI